MTDTAQAVRSTIVEELLQARFDEADHKVLRQGRGGEPQTYVEDETVMDRLDDVLGFGGWEVIEATPIGDKCVRIAIRLRHPGTKEWTTYTDFGYVTNTNSAEPLKEAWTDAFRRVARIPGVARYVYAGEAPAPTTEAAAPAYSQPAAAATPVPQTTPVPQAAEQTGSAEQGGKCPVHDWTWSVQPGGTSKSGKAYGAFYKCGGKTNGQFCHEKPSEEWVKAHPIPR